MAMTDTNFSERYYMKTPDEIHAFLRLAKVPPVRLVRELKKQRPNITKADITKTINGHQRNDEIRGLIAGRFGMRKEEFFEPEFDAITGSKRVA
jgi:hypothetical protein